MKILIAEDDIITTKLYKIGFNTPDADTGWELVDTTGGSGSNPVTDDTYKTSQYFVADLDANDKLGEIKLIDGVNQ